MKSARYRAYQACHSFFIFKRLKIARIKSLSRQLFSGDEIALSLREEMFMRGSSLLSGNEGRNALSKLCA